MLTAVKEEITPTVSSSNDLMIGLKSLTQNQQFFLPQRVFGLFIDLEVGLNSFLFPLLILIILLVLLVVMLVALVIASLSISGRTCYPS